MTDQQSLNPSASQETDSLPPLPGYVKALAISNIVVGLLLAALDVVGVGNSIADFRRDIPDKLFFHYLINIMIYIDVGLLFLVAGTALLNRRKWGRTLSFYAAGSCFVAWFAGYALAGVAKMLVESGDYRLSTRPRSYNFDEPMSLTILGPLYAVLVMIVLILPAAANWARSDTQVRIKKSKGGVRGFAILGIIILCTLISAIGAFFIGGYFLFVRSPR